MEYDTINDARTIAGNGEGTLLAGRYRIVRQLGQGGMGSVWLAEDTQLDNKPFAIKMLPSILVSNKRAYNQLKDEALVAMKLTHPNIVTLRAFEENNGNPFLVMDYIDGQTLDDYLADNGSRVERVDRVDGIGGARRPAEPVGSRVPRDRDGRGTRSACPPGGIPEADVLRILKPIAAALDYAHGEGVVHRDVKPANVMIRKDGHPFILDFGIAREIQETMTRVTGKLSSGTLLYMSPEQLMGEPPKPAQDIYSFAAMAYECLKGEPPFVRGAIEDQIKNKQPDPLATDALTGKAAILAAGVMSGLAKRPEDRPATCAAVLEGKDSSRVERVDRVDGVGGARRPAEPGGPRSRAAVKGILAAALLATLAGGAWWFLNARAARSTGTTGKGGAIPIETDIRDFTIKIPVLEYESGGAVFAAISNALVKCYGVESNSFLFDVTNRSVTVRYDLKKIVTNDIAIAVARAGYEANGVTPESVGQESLEQFIVQAVKKRKEAEELSFPSDIPDDAVFKERKDKVVGFMQKAKKLMARGWWREAAEQFTKYVDECKSLTELKNQRNAAWKAREKAMVVQNEAKTTEAEQHATNSWNNATNKLEKAETEFAHGNFLKARDLFVSANEAFSQCSKELDILRNALNTVQREAKELENSVKENISDDDSFGEETKALGKIFDRAEGLRELNLWSEAATEYSNCVEKCKGLMSKQENLKKSAEKERTNAARARNGAREAEKQKLAAWERANQLFDQATQKFNEKKYAAAHSDFIAASEQFKTCEKEAKKAKSKPAEVKTVVSEMSAALGYLSPPLARCPFEARIRVYILDGDCKNYVRAECECSSTAVKTRREMDDTLIVLGSDKELIVTCSLQYDGMMKTIVVQLSGKSENIREEELK